MGPKIMIKNLKFSSVFEATVKEAEAQAKAKAQQEAEKMIERNCKIETTTPTINKNKTSTKSENNTFHDDINTIEGPENLSKVLIHIKIFLNVTP